MINKLFLDLNNFKPNLGSVERGDSIELNIKLLNDEDYSRSKFRLLGAKSDGKSVEQIEGLNLEEKDLKVVLEDQFVNCEGIVKLELNVVSGETEITTKEFYFFVSNTMNAEIIDSADSIPTLEKVSKYVDDAVNNLDALKEASEDITIINSEFKENEIKRKANEMLREKNEKARLQSEDIRITEEEEREANELERIKAENNRKVSESNRKVSENTRVTNERAREEAELSRQSTFEENEEIRNSNENLRIESEKERIKFNNKAKTDEVNRKEAETKRVEAEKTRVIAEDERKKAETSRQEAEDIRQNTYTNFNEAEEERRNNEISRQEAEALRIEAEKRRDDLYSQKEEERNAAFLESERTRGTAFNEAQNDRNLTFEESEAIREEAFKVSEVARNEAEDGRVAAELLRVEAEKLRVAGEENRNNTFTQNEEERQGVFEEAENDRKVAESKRVKTESSRVEAEKLRVTAETGRVEAENLRATAEEERVAAETKREEGFNKFEGKINANTEELKNARSATTGEKFNSLDERIDCEVDRLNKKIEISILQQESAESHVIENSVDGMTTDMVIKGKTLQNIIIDGNRTNVIDNSINSNSRIHNFKASYNLQRGKKYVGYLKIDNIENSKYGLRLYGLGFGASGAYYTIGDKAGIYKFTWNTSTAPESIAEFHTLGIYLDNEDFVNGGKATFSDFMLFEEGTDLTYIDEYFEGIKSFGQQEDKISILSHGKNLIKEIERGNLNSNTGENTAGGTELLFRTKGYVNIKPSSNYIISCNLDINSGLIGFFYDENKKMIKTFSTLSAITPNNAKYLRFRARKSDNTNLTDLEFNSLKIQLEEGTIVTPYEPYKEDKKDILLQDLGFDEGLRGFDTNSCDVLNGVSKKAIKRIEKDIITGNEDFQKAGNSNYYFLIGNNHKPLSKTLNNKYPDKNCSNVEENGLWCGNAYKLCIKDLSVNTVEELKTKLKQWYVEENPLIIYYELAEPIETPLDESIALKVFNEKTYVSFENAISGTSSFKAPVNAAATISRLNRENRALEEKNKNLRQDFESTTLSLTDSDLELVKQNVDMDFRLMEVEFALDIPQAILSSNINFKNKKGEVKSKARTPYEMMKIVILSGDYDKEDYMYKVGKYYERGRMTKEEHDELMSLMTADEVISK
ncbi:hypothetical protein P5F14_02155 [Clostridium perfringens]|nr:hypothetical protein [Clostridium perfringens]MDK0754263.1 hypothetical protein [Clostridium perfringens]MDK0757437.1 hypothetical protein [Clostridium perfringens]